MKHCALSVFILILLTSCALEVQPNNTRRVDAELEEYVQTFEKAYGKPISFPVVLGIVTFPAVARCLKWKNGKKLVTIGMTWYESVKNSPSRVEQVVLHEMGHCELYREHKNNVTDLGEGKRGPASVMQSTEFGENSVYENNREYYIKELIEAK